MNTIQTSQILVTKQVRSAVAVFVATLAFFTNSSPASAQDCSIKTNMRGLWRVESHSPNPTAADIASQDRFRIDQTGCRLFVTELDGRSAGSTYEIDLSGLRTSEVPQRSIDANRAHTDANGIESLRSIRFQTKLVYERESSLRADITLNARILPMERLPNAIRLVVLGGMEIRRDAQTNQATFVRLQIEKMQLLDIEDLQSSISKTAFLMGANFVMDIMEAKTFMRTPVLTLVRDRSN